MRISCFSILMLCSFFFFTACSKGDHEEKDREHFEDKQEEEREEDERGEDDKDDRYNVSKDFCYDFVYPISYILPDGTTISGNEEELDAALKAWYDAHPDVETEPELQFPIEIILEDRSVHRVNDGAALRIIEARCKEDVRKDCYEFVYPISYTLPDGSTISGNSGEEIEIAIKAWYDANPNADQRPSLNFPVDLIFDDVENKTIQNEEEFKAINERCEANYEEKEECFDFVYPISYTLPDGSVITGDTEEALWDAMKAWYDAHPDIDQRADLNFPVDVLFEDGTTITLASNEDLRRAYEACE